MNTSLVGEIASLRQKIAELEKELAAEIARLPSEFGFSTTAAFIKAVRAAYSSVGRSSAPARRRTKGKKARAVITDETRAKVKSLIEEGKTGAFVAENVGISVASVNLIKKAAGLVKARTPSAAKAASKTKRSAKK